MIRLLHSGKFWLKLAAFCILAAILATIGLNVLLRHVFSTDQVRRHTEAFIRKTGRTINFDRSVGRSLLPRPTLTLKNVVISTPDGNHPAILIRETKIGFAWSALWSDNAPIEKWVVSGADTTLEQTPDGWNLQDLWQQPAGSTPNRLIIESSRINVRLPQGSYKIENFGLNTQRPEAGGRPFKINGTLQHDTLPLRWQGNGIWRTSGGNWETPSFHLEAAGRLNDHTLTVSTDSALLWQPQSSTLQARNFNLRADSSFHNLHLTAQSPLITLRNNHLSLNALSSAFTAGTSESRWDGSLELDKVSLRPSIAVLDNFKFNAGHKTEQQYTTFTLSGPAIWQRSKGAFSDGLRINTHQDTLVKAPRPRFISAFEGSFSMPDLNHWQGQFKGLFDRQPAALTVRYAAEPEQQPRLEAGIALSKLSLTPYWDDLQTHSSKAYPGFLSRSGAPAIEAQIKIDAITLPGLQLDNVETLLSADKDHIALSNFKAGLYGGKTEGGISMANTEPPSYHLQQNAQGVQVRRLLQDLLTVNSISGTGDAVIDLTARGQDRTSLTKTLKGTLTLNVSNGAWLGIDIDNIMQSGTISRRGHNGEIPRTPFRRFSLTSTIDQGISRHFNTEVTSDSLLIVSNGFTDLGKQELSEEMLIRNARNPKAKPIPLKINGPINNPSITIDYSRLTNGLSTPAEKQKALENTLKEQWQWLNPNRE